MGEKIATSDLFDFQVSLLEKEIEYIHSQIAHFDTLSFQIKGWATTIWAAVVAFGAQAHAPAVILAAVPATLTFWILDAFFKQYQRRVQRRKAAIESFLDSSDVFAGKGLREAFAARDFGVFPIHDPISRRTSRLHHDFEIQKRTSYWKAFTAASLLYFYLLLVGSSVLVALTVWSFTPPEREPRSRLTRLLQRTLELSSAVGPATAVGFEHLVSPRKKRISKHPIEAPKVGAELMKWLGRRSQKSRAEEHPPRTQEAPSGAAGDRGTLPVGSGRP